MDLSVIIQNYTLAANTICCQKLEYNLSNYGSNLI